MNPFTSNRTAIQFCLLPIFQHVSVTPNWVDSVCFMSLSSVHALYSHLITYSAQPIPTHATLTQVSCKQQVHGLHSHHHIHASSLLLSV
ncbi:unnamed protein product [Closterium sp. NIES-54]